MSDANLAGASAPVELTNAPATETDNSVNEPATAAEQQQPEGDQAPKPEKAFSQAEVDEMVQKRLAKAERAWERKHRQMLETTLEKVVSGREPARTEAAPASSEAMPRPEQFSDYAEYLTAVARFEARQELHAERERASKAEQAKTQAERAATLQASFQRQAAAAAAKYADFEDVAFAPDVPVSEAMAAAIAESEQGAEIAYHLGRNKAEAARIAALGPLAAAREIGKLEVRLSQVSTPEVSRAPAPIAPVGGRAKVAKDPGSMSDAEYAKWRKSHR